MPQITLHPAFNSIRLAYETCACSLHSNAWYFLYGIFFVVLFQNETFIILSLWWMFVCFLFISFLVPVFHLFALLVVDNYNVLIYFSISLLFNIGKSINIIEFFQYSVCEFSMAFHNDPLSFSKSFISKTWFCLLID